MPIVRVSVEPTVLEWAIKRSQREDYLREKIPNLNAWLSGDRQPTWRQLEDFAKKAYVASGYLFLKEPPEERTPIADFRTFDDRTPSEISPNLRDTIYICQRRQWWFRRYALLHDNNPLGFVGSVDHNASPIDVATNIRETLGIDNHWLETVKNWQAYRRALISRLEDLGVLIMVSGIVKANTQRKLDLLEFRGFAIPDEYAPVVFVNGADTHEAQLFTIVHELAHIWCGQEGLSEPDNVPVPQHRTEAWCNSVASEFLTPSNQLWELVPRGANPLDFVNTLQRHFKVSKLVVLRGLLDSDFIPPTHFTEVYERERLRALAERQYQSGGNYYPTQMMRVGRKFASALLCDTFQLNTEYTEALNLLEIRKISTLKEFARQIGVLR